MMCEAVVQKGPLQWSCHEPHCASLLLHTYPGLSTERLVHQQASSALRRADPRGRRSLLCQMSHPCLTRPSAEVALATVSVPSCEHVLGRANV